MTPNLTFHLLKTDCHRCRIWLIIYALLCLAQAVSGTSSPTSMAGEMGPSMLVFGQIVLGALLILNTIHGDALVGDSAAWKTRPVSRRHLFGAKLIFIAGIVQGGFIMAQLPGWWTNGFDTQLMLGSALQWLIITGAIIWTAAAAAAWSNDLKTFMGKAGLVVLGLIAFVILCERLHLTGSRQPFSPTRSTSALALMFLLVAFGAFGSWALATLRGRINQAIALYVTVFIAGLVLLWKSPVDLLARKPVPWQAGEIGLITDIDISDQVPAGEQLLYSHFRVTGLPSNTMAVPFRLSGVFRKPDSKPRQQVQLHDSVQDRGVSSLAKLQDNSMDGELLHRLAAFYPPDTLWFGNRHVQTQRSLPTMDSPKASHDWLAARPEGQLDATVQVELITLRRIADVPLRTGMRHAGNGIGISILSETERETGHEFHIRESIPNVWFSDRPEHLGQHPYRSHCLYVIHDPASGEAWPIDIRSSHSRPVNPLSNTYTTVMRHSLSRSTLSERLAGRVSEKRPDLRLHAYYPESAGRRTASFKDKHYVWASERTAKHGAVPIDGATTNLAALHWPGAENTAAAEKFFDDFLALLPRHSVSPLRQQATAKLLEVGAAGVPLLLNRLPLRDSVRYAVDPALRKLVNRSHLPTLLKTLARHPEFAALFRSLRWEEEAAPILLPMLASREQPLPRDALTLVAKFARPEQYPDLRWHAVHVDDNSEQTLKALAALPGFPHDEVVRERWKNHLIHQGPGSSLAAYAARIGELSALRELVVNMEIGYDATHEAFLLGTLRDAIEFQGDLPALKAWLSTHLEKLRFDPVLARFRVVEG